LGSLVEKKRIKGKGAKKPRPKKREKKSKKKKKVKKNLEVLASFEFLCRALLLLC